MRLWVAPDDVLDVLKTYRFREDCDYSILVATADDEVDSSIYVVDHSTSPIRGMIVTIDVPVVGGLWDDRGTWKRGSSAGRFPSNLGMAVAATFKFLRETRFPNDVMGKSGFGERMHIEEFVAQANFMRDLSKKTDPPKSDFKSLMELMRPPAHSCITDIRDSFDGDDNPWRRLTYEIDKTLKKDSPKLIFDQFALDSILIGEAKAVSGSETLFDRDAPKPLERPTSHHSYTASPDDASRPIGNTERRRRAWSPKRDEGDAGLFKRIFGR